MFDPEALAARLGALPNVVAVALGGSRATGHARPDSDWDLGLYYRGSFDERGIAALGWPGAVVAPHSWGRLVNGGAWLDVDGVRVDVIYRDLDEVLFHLAEAQHGRFIVVREVGYVAGMASYVLAGELAINRVLYGELPRPDYPAVLRESAPPWWESIAAGALAFATSAAAHGDVVVCGANLTQALLAAAQARLARAGEWALNEKRLIARAGLEPVGGILSQLGSSAADLAAAVEAVTPHLNLPVSWGRARHRGTGQPTSR